MGFRDLRAFSLQTSGAQPIRWALEYNACTESCDMYAGPCACGAWHRSELSGCMERLMPKFHAMVRAGITEDMTC